MSEELLKAFRKAIKADAILQEKLKAADAEAVVLIAKEAGFNISVEDLEVRVSEDLSEEELEGVAGGRKLREGVDTGARCPTFDKTYCTTYYCNI
jgi:predicted ribosomally synthesized peptide with nif11-like leader